MGYLYAWNRFWIATPGSIAAYAVGTTTSSAAGRFRSIRDGKVRRDRAHRRVHRASTA